MATEDFRPVMPQFAPGRRIEVDPYSVTATPLQMTFQSQVISSGTAFFWRRNNRTYLITNWHNVSGKNPRTGVHLSPTAAEPNSLSFDVFEGGDINRRRAAIGQIRDAQGKPLWLEHPVHRKRVDVVALELGSLNPKWVYPINELAVGSIRAQIGGDAFILGFPMGVGPSRMAIWKRASIATEPDIDVENLPLMYVDTATSAGMSGSPVIIRSTLGERDDGSRVMMLGPMTRFIGIYSGRLQPDGAVGAQLGFIWKAPVIDEIIDGQQLGSTE
ncbi:trypsin-like peptidase domain-containing protein [Phenylobacterium terrae]|uniref:Trypsin-like peptidase domain-containing protein n=1 Tax=Phenylobacterium terrae TaxID=2665495 RepID=A0ABW4NAJ4_9CAUL